MGQVHDWSRSAALVASVASVAAAATMLPACSGCGGSHPSTPYKLTDAPSATASGSAAAGLDGGAPGAAFAVIAGTPAPGDGKSWPLEGGAVVEAPAGRAFSVGFVADLDGDKKADLVAWAKA